MIDIKKLLERGWTIEEDKKIFKKFYKPSLNIIIINLETEIGKVISYGSKYGKLELEFKISNFENLEDLEIFCIKFFINFGA